MTIAYHKLWSYFFIYTTIDNIGNKNYNYYRPTVSREIVEVKHENYENT